MTAPEPVTDQVPAFAPARIIQDTAAPAPLRLLVVEDSAPGHAAAAAWLDPAPPTFIGSVVRVQRRAEAQRSLAEGAFDVVLLDQPLLDAEGTAAVASLVEQHPDVPVVVMTADADDRQALSALEAGAQDCLVAGQEDARSVRRALRHAIERHRLQRQMADRLRDEHEHRTAAEQASRARDEMLAIVSHDLRNPLSAISFGAASLSSVAPEEIPHIAEIIDRSTRSAVHIIRDLLDISAIEAGRLSCHRELMLTQVIAEQVVTTFAAPASHAALTFSVEIEGAPRWVDVDVDRIVQAVGNLVANAIAFTPPGGSIAVRCLGGPSGGLRIAVTDTGPGIPADQLPFLFDRFWQARTRRGGAGLGLAIARGIAVSHGGTIEVATEPGVGSTFTLVIPAAARSGDSEGDGVRP